jgi:branched-chain amino acid transport system substrate-binding protein
MVRSKWIRPISVLIAAAVIVAGCSSDDDSSSDTTSGATSETTAPTTEASAPTTEDGLTGDGLELGLLAPAPGLLATLFQGQQRGADFAVEDVNDAGGVLDGPLTVTTSVAEPGAAPADNVIAAIDDGAQALIGPAGSSGGMEVRDEVAALESTICSASATAPTLTLGQDPMVLFRTATPDDVTAAYLADQIIERRDEVAPDAAWKVAIVTRADDYGQSVSNTLAAILQSAGLAPSVIDYNPRRVTFAGTAEEVAALAPDVTILVTYEEGGNLLSALVSAGLDPSKMIGLDAFFAPRIAEIASAGVDASSVDGFQILGSMGNRAFLTRLYEADPNGQVANAPQAYDCAVVMALATEALDAGTAGTLAQAAIDVTGDGVRCSTYEDCLDKLTSGDDINYDGVTGEIALDDNGDPTFARFTSAMLEDGKVSNIENSDVDIAELRRQYEAYAASNLNTKIQEALTFLGFYSGPINGLESPEMTAAIAAFQTSVGLPPTGIWDAATDAAMREALGEQAAALTQSTMEVQQLLTELGFYTGPIDGIWSQEVTDAVKALQRELGVPETGIIDAATLQAVYDRGAANGTPPATTVPPETTVPTPETTAPPATVPPETVPPETVPPVVLPTLLEALEAAGNYGIFLQVIAVADVPAEFDRLANYTVVAPNDDAFTDPTLVDALLADPAAAADFVFQLLVQDETSLLVDLPPVLTTVYGSTLSVGPDASGGTAIGGALVVLADTLASNGVIQQVGTLPVPTP